MMKSYCIILYVVILFCFLRVSFLSKCVFLIFLDMVEKTDAWTEIVSFQELSILFDSFNIVKREDPSQVSFIENFLKASNFK